MEPHKFPAIRFEDFSNYEYVLLLFQCSGRLKCVQLSCLVPWPSLKAENSFDNINFSAVSRGGGGDFVWCSIQFFERGKAPLCPKAWAPLMLITSSVFYST